MASAVPVAPSKPFSLQSFQSPGRLLDDLRPIAPPYRWQRDSQRLIERKIRLADTADMDFVLTGELSETFMGCRGARLSIFLKTP